MRYDQLYQEPTPPPPLWRRIGKLLLCLLLVAGAISGGLLLLLQPYVVYSRDGVRLELPKPTQEVEKKPEEQAAFSPQIPVSAKGEEGSPIHAVLLPVDSLTQGTVQEEAAQAGCNSVVFSMKDPDGNLNYLSQLAMARETGASDGDPSRNDAIRALNRQEGLYTVAMVSCFRDDRTARAYPDLALRRKSGSAWGDGEELAWLAPHSREGTEYLTGICRELADLGFDEILLVNAGYPTEGALDQLGPGSAPQSTESFDTIASFYQAAKKALDGTDTRLGIRTESTASQAGGNPISGQSLDNIAIADRIWQENAGAELRTAFAQDGADVSREKVVDIRTSSGEDFLSWAVF